MENVELLGLGIYSVSEAHRLTRISPSKLRRWLKGYAFKHDGETHYSPRVVAGQLPIMDQTLALSFRDLQEVRCLEEFRQRGIGWKTLREAHDKAVREMGTDHPFSTGQFKSVGRRIMREYANESGDTILRDLMRGQYGFHEVLKSYLRGLVYAGGNFPVRWYPMARSRRVVIDPARAFGAPIVAKRGVPTETLWRAYKAERSYERVARWYEVDLPSVKDAVAYETSLARAA